MASSGNFITFYHFLPQALERSEWLASRPGHFTPSAHRTRGWVGPRAGVDDVENIKLSCPRQEPNHDSPAVQPIFYSLHWRGTHSSAHKRTQTRMSGEWTPAGHSTPSHIYITALLIPRDMFTTRQGLQTVTFVLIKHFASLQQQADSNLIGVTRPADHLRGPPTQHVDRCTRVEMAVREWLPMHEHDLYKRRNLKKKLVPGWEKYL